MKFYKYFRVITIIATFLSLTLQPVLPVIFAMSADSALFQTAAPDLVPTSFQTVSSASSQERIVVNWTVENRGTAEATASWRDYFYLSTNDTYDSQDIYIIYQTRSTSLPVGGSYDVSREIVLPKVPAGDYFLILRVDGLNAKAELDENNNDYALPISISNPDLLPIHFDAPTAGSSQSQITISWTINNQGIGTAQPSWSDYVYLSLNDTYESGDTLITSFSWSQALLSLGTYSQSKSITLPKVAAGDYYLLIYSDGNNSLFESNESNNVLASPITIANPDLVPTQLLGPNNATSQEQIQVSWTVQNNGSGVATPSWRDSFYLSTDDIYDSSDVYIRYFTVSSTLQAGDSYTMNQQTITLPSVSNGDYYLFVRTDYANSLYEADEANNVIGIPISISNPDLTITGATATDTASSQEPIQVNWTVKNIGLGTAQPSWYDAIYLSTDDAYSSDDVYITRFYRTQAVLPEDSYTQSQVITLPKVAAGAYYLIFRSDYSNILYETDNANNDLAVPITIKNPNLKPLSFSAPASVSSQDTVQLEWVVENLDTGSAHPSWRDRVYLSLDAVYDSSDTAITYFTWSQIVASGGSYTQTRNITIPKVAAQNYFLLIGVDYANALFESNEGDNYISTPIEIKNPDISPIELIAPETASTQDLIEVSWTGLNQGSGDANLSWIDTLYLSLDDQLDSLDTTLASFTISQVVLTNTSYTQTRAITIPKVPGGDYFLILKLNSNNALYESNSDNNILAIPITLDLADLKLETIQAPIAASVNQQIELGWTVTNIGSGVASPYWYDRVYLSIDNVWDAADVLLGSYTYSSPVEPAESYTQRQRFTIPAGTIPGAYYFIVRVDSTNRLYEANEGNNDRAVLVEIQEIDFVDLPWRTLESGLSTALGSVAFSPDGKHLAAISNLVAMQWDLQSGKIVRKYTGHTSQIDTVDYSPNGDQILTGARDGSSRIWDSATGLQKRSFAAKPGDINPAVFSTDGTMVFAGSGLNTPRLWDSLTGVELRMFPGHTAAVNDVALSPIGDLALTGSSDKTAIIWNTSTGDRVFTLNGHTSSVRTVKFAPLMELVLTGSDDGTIKLWNYSTGELVGAFVQGTPVVSADFSVDGEYIISCDNRSPGSAYLWEINTGRLIKIFRSTSGDTSVINRVAFSPDQAFIATSRSSGKIDIWPSNLAVVSSEPVTELTISEPVSFEISPLGFNVFSLPTEFDKNLVVSLDGINRSIRENNIRIANDLREAGQTVVVMAVKFGRQPSMQDYDQIIELSMDQLQGDLPIAPTYDGTYYISVYSPYLSQGKIPAQIQADYVDMHISSVEPRQGGNHGNLTLKITGTRFSPITTAQLIDPTGNRINGSIIARPDDTTLYATFQMVNAALGAYDIRIEDDGVVQIMFDGLEIVPTVSSKVSVELNAPSAIRPGREGVLTVEYENKGNIDLEVPLLKISAENAELRFPFYQDFLGSSIILYGVNNVDPISILQPGTKGQIQLIFRPKSTGTAVNFSVHLLKISGNNNAAIELATNYESLNKTNQVWNQSTTDFKFPFEKNAYFTGGPHGGGIAPCLEITISNANALDFAKGGFEVLSIADGIYIGKGETSDSVGVGIWVTIEHAGGIRSSYWHLANTSSELQKLSEGDKITQGFPIGVAGESGGQEGVHLHIALGTEKSGAQYAYQMNPIPWDGFEIDGRTIWSIRMPGSSTQGISYRGSIVEGETKSN
jgi:WD40 repeat protein